jgi:hypothetical protein
MERPRGERLDWMGGEDRPSAETADGWFHGEALAP